MILTTRTEAQPKPKFSGSGMPVNRRRASDPHFSFGITLILTTRTEAQPKPKFNGSGMPVNRRRASDPHFS